MRDLGTRRVTARHSAARRRAIAAFLTLPLLASAVPVLAGPIDEHGHDESVHHPPAVKDTSALRGAGYDTLRALPIQAGGRIKPFDTFAREQVYAVCGEYAPRDAKDEDPCYTVLQMAHAPGSFRERAVIVVRNLELVKAFRGQEGQKTHVSVKECEENPEFKKIVDAQNWEKSKGLTPTELATRELLTRVHTFRQLPTLIRLLPVSDELERPWVPISQASEAFPDGRFKPLQDEAASMAAAFEKNDPAAFEAAEAKVAERLRGYDFRVYPPDSVLSLELTYNTLRPFRTAYLLFYLSAVLFLIHRVKVKSKGLWGAAFGVLCLGVALHVGGTLARTYITQYAPVGSLYETAVWIGGVGVLLALGFEATTRQSTAGLAGSIFGALLLTLADRLPLLAGTLGETAARHVDAAMNPLQPVLRSYWLNIHVTCMLTSYGALGLACLIGLDYGATYLKNGGWSQSKAWVKYFFANLGAPAAAPADGAPAAAPEGVPAPAAEPKAAPAADAKLPQKPGPLQAPPEVLEKLERLEQFNYRVIQVGFSLLTTGVLLGAVWANQSWGRYWGWDPKETWAFITWLIYAAYLHFRFMGWVKGPVSTLWNIVGFGAVLFTYIGVSFLLPGLHSYLQPS